MSEFTGNQDDSSLSYSDQSVSLGGYVLTGWEIPEQITWGGAQRMNVHKFVGGSRYIDVMGQDNDAVTWSGRFLGPDASFRADEIDQMRKAGEVVELIFAGRYYQAVIASLSLQQQTQFLIPYKISLTILTDESYVTPPDLTPLQAVSMDITAADDELMPPPLLPVDAIYLATAVLAPLAPIQTALAATEALLVPMTAITAATAATAALTGSMTAAMTLTTTAAALASGQLSTLAAASAAATLGTAAAGLAGATNVASAISNMQIAVASTYAMATTVTSAAYLGRAITNTANA